MDGPWVRFFAILCRRGERGAQVRSVVRLLTVRWGARVRLAFLLAAGVPGSPHPSTSPDGLHHGAFADLPAQRLHERVRVVGLALDRPAGAVHQPQPGPPHRPAPVLPPPPASRPPAQRSRPPGAPPRAGSRPGVPPSPRLPRPARRCCPSRRHNAQGKERVRASRRKHSECALSFHAATTHHASRAQHLAA